MAFGKEPLHLAALSEEQCEFAREWRNAAVETLRTPFLLTHEMQRDFYRTVICDRRAPHRYWAAIHPVNVPRFVGMGGMTNIQWESGLAEISLILNPKLLGQGYGRATVDLLLDEAFSRMRLLTVVGECYECNPAVGFWRKIVASRPGASAVTLPRRKWWQGRLWDAYYFTIPAPEST